MRFIDLVILICCLAESVFSQLFLVAVHGLLALLGPTLDLRTATISSFRGADMWPTNDAVTGITADGIAPIGGSPIVAIGVVTFFFSRDSAPRRSSGWGITLWVAFVNGFIRPIVLPMVCPVAGATPGGTLFVFDLTAPVVTIYRPSTSVPDFATFALRRTEFPTGDTVAAIIGFLGAPGTEALLERSDKLTGLIDVFPFGSTAKQT